MYVSPETFALMQKLAKVDEATVAELFASLHRDALVTAPPASSSGINEERETIRNQSTYAERKRAKDRERQRQLREAARQSRDIDGDPATNRATSTATEGDKAATTGDPAPSRAPPQVVIPSLPSLRSEELGVGGGDTRPSVPQTDDWPKGGAQHHAKLLVEATASPWLDPNRSPDLVTTAGRIAAWKREGASWEHDVCAVVAGLMANRRSRVSSWKFFDQPVARSIADNRAALEIPEASRSPRGQGPPMSFAAQAAADAAEARRRVLES